MMMRGDPIHGEISSADCSSTPATATIYAAGNPTAITLGSDQWIEITDIQFSSTVGGAYVMYAGTNIAGQRIIKGNAAATGGLTIRYSTPIVCKRGEVPAMVAAAGQVDVIFTGYLVEV